jgi:hypothetical protein
MAHTTTFKYLLNQALAPLGMKLDSLTAERREMQRLTELESAGYFDSPRFSVPAALSDMDPASIFRDLELHASRFDDLTKEDDNPVAYSFDNPFFSSPDAEVLYAIVRAFEPKTIVEVGCGHSTRIIRLAIMDGGFESRIVGIDPCPRRAIADITDEVHSCPVEAIADLSIFTDLKRGDILSIDSSHELKVGNDVLFLYLKVLPQLNPGVIVHIHDIFLPYEYKRNWVIEDRRQYTEQYIVQMMLDCSDWFEAIWAGFYLQKTREDFPRYFPHIGKRSAQSLWLRKVSRERPLLKS